MSHSDTGISNVNPNPPTPVVINNPPAHSGADRYFTADDLEKARQQEKDKLYKAQEKLRENFETMQGELKRLNDEREAREAEDKRRADEVEAARKAAEEAELSAKEILAKRESEWTQQIEDIKTQMASQSAIFAKEREFQALKGYVQQQIEAHREEIIPELYDTVTGNTKEEIDASIQNVIAKSSAILEGVNRMQSAQRAGQQGVSSAGFTPGGPIDGVPGQQGELTNEDIAAMDMDAYAKFRESRGFGGNNDYSMSKLWG
ncbi:MAG TPA: hypothetical protein VGR89_07390 [Puia sp.]|nr:hypothetical protein [Puia sp.]